MIKSVIVLLLGTGILRAQVDVLTANYSNSRSSANLAESLLSPATVSPETFGKLASFPIAGQLYAQPLVVTGLPIAACGTCDVVFVATMQNNVYAFNATTLDPTPLWIAKLGPPVASSLLRFEGAVTGSVGVLGTPVIDRGRGLIYLLAERMRSGKPAFELHALDLATGNEQLNGPVDVTATVDGSGDANVNGRITLDPLRHIQRPGLLAANSRIYIAFGSIYDRKPYHGWVLAYDIDTLQQTAVFNATPNGGLGGIWQSGRGLAADSSGNIFLGTGNGDYDGLTNFGETFLRMGSDLQVVDWFTPSDWQGLSDVDLDTASLGPMLIPSIDMILGGDKAGNGYLIDQSNMGHLGLTGASVAQTFQPVEYGGLFNAAVWDRSDGPLVYFVDEGISTSGFRITNRQVEASPFSITEVTSDYPWQGMAISAWGETDGSGILWLTVGDHDQAEAPGTLIAFNAQDLTQVLWTSDASDRDSLGLFAKFTTPTVANGLVFVPTASGQLVVYGLLDPVTPRVRSIRSPLH